MSVELPRLLVIETSARVGRVAVALGPSVLDSRELEETRRHARDLAPAVRDLLAAQGWQPRDVHAAIVSKGPGSYTGLRVGIMSAKTFAYATGCKLVGVETFAALALQAPVAVYAVDVFADAQQDRVYVQRFVRAEGEDFPCAHDALCIRPFAEWLADADKAPWVTGPGLRGKTDRLLPGIQAVPEADWEVRPESLVWLGLRQLEQGQMDDLWHLEPLYLRPSAAETQWDTRPAKR